MKNFSKTIAVALLMATLTMNVNAQKTSAKPFGPLPT